MEAKNEVNKEMLVNAFLVGFLTAYNKQEIEDGTGENVFDDFNDFKKSGLYDVARKEAEKFFI